MVPPSSEDHPSMIDLDSITAEPPAGSTAFEERLARWLADVAANGRAA